MTSQATDTTGAVIPYDPKAENTDSEADPVDRIGNAILGLINSAVGTAETDLQTAREVAEKLADQLRAAHSQINELEARVRHYQGRTERAEKWLHQISSKIEQRFFGAEDSDGTRQLAERLQNQDKIRAAPRPAKREPATPSFLRRFAKH